MNTVEKLLKLKKHAYHGVWAERIIAELQTVLGLFQSSNRPLPEKVCTSIEKLYDYFNENGNLTKEIALMVEEELAEFSEEIKSYKVILTSHAHIDMNWMWGFQETVSVTIDTFRTMLNLMEEYPEFTFSQSQASTYQIIEEYAPEMIEEIKQRIHEGRWEVTASTWVETDKNMPNGESHARHILYTKKYLSKLFDIPEESMELDFEPDTFGHHKNTPEICNKGGVKYYYHCRAFDGAHIYRWRSPSGAELLVYREPQWYNAEITSESFAFVPDFANRYGIKTVLSLVGVGDHGGGPTRRDVERVLAMKEWPLYPTIKFGTMHEFYHELEQWRDRFEVVDHELNFIFTGCYTSQSRIKMANRISEDRLYASEVLTGISSAFAGGRSYTKSFEQAWRNTLFNHFHDILPGSGKVDTREYAMGNFQKTMAHVGANANLSMKNLAAKIDTSSIVTEDDRLSISEGAGVGFDTEYTTWGAGERAIYGFPKTERGRGNTRIFNVFNTTQYYREQVVIITIWDWQGDLDRLSVYDTDGNKVESKVLNTGDFYWGHTFVKVAVSASVPGFGYSTYIVKQDESKKMDPAYIGWERSDHIDNDNIVLENSKIRAEFDAVSAKLISLINKDTGKEMIDVAQGSCSLNFIKESTKDGMTSWRVGKYMNVIDMNEECDVKIEKTEKSGPIKMLEYTIAYLRSKFRVVISLYGESSMLDFRINADWHEIGTWETFIPQLNFRVPLGYDAGKYRYDVPFGVIDRNEISHDVPGNSFACALPDTEGAGAVMVVTDTKYGFKGCDNEIAVDLIRSSFDPDPYPEYGEHQIAIGVAVVDDVAPETLYEVASEMVQPLHVVANTSHEGELPMNAQFINVKGDVKISSIKNPECGCTNALVIKVYESKGEAQDVSIVFDKDIAEAYFVDFNENKVEGDVKVSGDVLEFVVPADQVVSVLVKL